MPEPRNNQGKIPNTLTPMTWCGLGTGCNTCTGLPRGGQAVVAFPSASMLPISEYRKLETLQALPRWLTADTKPNACSHSSTISTLQRRGRSTRCPPPHSPLLTQDSATSGTFQKGAAKRGLSEGGCQKLSMPQPVAAPSPQDDH